MNNEEIFDNDDIDLLKIINSNNDTNNQYIVFTAQNGQFYAININVICEILLFSDAMVAFNNDENSPFFGTADIRDEVMSLIDWDKYCGGAKILSDELKLLIVLEKDGKKLAIAIGDAEDLIEILPENLTDNSHENPKSSAIAKISINNKQTLCSIVNIDYLFGCDK